MPSIINDLRHYDTNLLDVLLTDKFIINNYSKTINDNTLFDFKSLINLFKYHNFWQDSYTSFSNKVGLTTNNNYLNNYSDVVLSFPFKDTVLKGGMTEENEDDTNNNEPFLNEIISRDQINEMFEDKALNHASKYDVNGEHQATSFTDEDNLILKGNNLIALHSLQKRYTGKIKSIILDAPYYFKNKKSGDTFEYNSNFHLSTWLVFMKNRLEIAKKLLSNDGFLIMIMGNDGTSYLKNLTDEIFNITQHPQRYIGTISWRKDATQPNVGNFANVTDKILIYKNNDNGQLNRLPLTNKAKKEYNYNDHDSKGPYRRANIMDKTRGRFHYYIKTPNGNKLNGPWMISEQQYLHLKRNNGIYWPNGGNQTPYRKTYLSETINKGQIPSDFWDKSYGTNQDGTKEIKKLFGQKAFTTPKPELLIRNLISITTDKDDIVLDFFMGSATTQAVAMKMHRRFIGIEQMDYINTVSVPRLQKVIDGEQGGISKAVDWQGGGSFVYAELMDKNQRFINALEQVTSQFDLDNLYEDMKNYHADLDIHVDLDSFEKEKNKHSFTEQKQMLIQMINKNQLYYNYHNLDDKDVKGLISRDDYKFNQSFYNRREDE